METRDPLPQTVMARWVDLERKYIVDGQEVEMGYTPEGESHRFYVSYGTPEGYPNVGPGSMENTFTRARCAKVCGLADGMGTPLDIPNALWAAFVADPPYDNGETGWMTGVIGGAGLPPGHNLQVFHKWEMWDTPEGEVWYQVGGSPAYWGAPNAASCIAQACLLTAMLRYVGVTNCEAVYLCPWLSAVEGETQYADGTGWQRQPGPNDNLWAPQVKMNDVQQLWMGLSPTNPTPVRHWCLAMENDFYEGAVRLGVEEPYELFTAWAAGYHGTDMLSALLNGASEDCYRWVWHDEENDIWYGGPLLPVR